MAKGLKQAKAKAGKGKGTEETASDGGLGKTPIQRAPLLANRFSQASAQGSGVPYLLPLLTAHIETPCLPHPRAHIAGWL